MDNSNRPSIRAYVGASGSGKGVSVREHLKKEKPTRLLVWDPLHEYGFACRTVTGDLSVVAKACAAPAFTVAYWPGADAGKFAERFAIFCRIAWAAGNCTVLVEELADVTTASFAPQPWARLTRQGRHRGLRLVACTQRPAKVDKDFLGSTTYVRCFTLRYPDDRRAMAAILGVPGADVDALHTTEGEKVTEINFIERDFRGGKATNGRIRLPRE